VKALRAGEKVEILAFDILVGDILLLEKGDLIPADGIVLESFALLIDESSMTGESDMIEKSKVSFFYYLLFSFFCCLFGETKGIYLFINTKYVLFILFYF
jgi:P-type E1-E2 ATPase